MNSISIQSIYKNFGDTPALQGVSLELAEGELFGLIGPDGAGKTTLFRILTGLLLADKGKAFLLGQDVEKHFRTLRSVIGYMPGRFSLYQDLTVDENLNFFATVFGTTVAENYHLIKDIYSQIEPFKKRRAGKLSGGMKQKLALSCALIHSPKILILDEPTTGVDAVSRVEFWEMLQNIKAQGISIIVSTPYMEEAAKCDRIALIQKGRVMQTDSPDGITNSFKASLLEIQTKDSFRWKEALKEEYGEHSAYLSGQSIHLVLPQGKSVAEVENWFKVKGHQEVEINETKAGIEDCFIHAMAGNKSA